MMSFTLIGIVLGLILYNGQQSGGSGDFVSLGLNSGFVEFRFDVGSGPAIIKSTLPVSLGQWHTVQLIRNRRDGLYFYVCCFLSFLFCLRSIVCCIFQSTRQSLFLMPVFFFFFSLF